MQCFILQNEFSQAQDSFKVTLFNDAVHQFNFELGQLYIFKNFGVKFHKDFKYSSEIYLTSDSVMEPYSIKKTKKKPKIEDSPKKEDNAVVIE